MTTPELAGQISLTEYLDNLSADDVKDALDKQDPPSLDDTKAASLLRKLGSLEKVIDANTEMAASERRKIDAWQAQVNEPLMNEANYLRRVLEGYALHIRSQDEDRKTISTPFGTLSTRPANPEWQVTDKDELVRWAQASNIADAVRVKVEPAMTVLKNALCPVDTGDGTWEVATPEGETVPGVQIVRPAAPFTVSIKARR